MISQMGEMVKILQWNAQGVSTSKKDLLKTIEKHEPGIIEIQETFLANFTVKVKRYSSYCKQGNVNRRYHGGVATYVHESIPTERLIIELHFQVVAMRVNIKKNLTITIANTYLPGSTNFVRGEMCRIINSLPNPKILVGDFNAHNTVWGNECMDRRGTRLECDEQWFGYTYVGDCD